MDLSKFDTRTTSTTGKMFDLVIAGETILGDDANPVQFCIKGGDDPEVRDKLIGIQKSKDGDGVAQDIDVASLALMGWSGNFEFNGTKPVFSAKTAREIASVPIFSGFVIGKAVNRLNFITKD